jgi:hypothetical protein
MKTGHIDCLTWAGSLVYSGRDMTEPPAPKPASVTVNPTFWELFIASLSVIRYQGVLILLHTIFPLAGLCLLVAPFYMGRGPEISQVLLALLAFSFTPLITALAVWSSRRRNRLAQGPFTYVFDADGVHTSSAAFKQTIQWAGILRVRRSRRFLFLFLSPSKALCVPLKALTEQGMLEEVLNLVHQHTDFRQSDVDHDRRTT